MKLHNVIKKIYNLMLIRKYRMVVGKNVIIGGRLFVKGTRGSISIGHNTIINSDKYAVPLGYQSQTIFWTMNDGNIEIGANCGITNSTFCSSSRITLEDYVTIGGGVKFFDTDFHSINFEKRIDYENDDDRRTKPIKVKKGAFIGAGSIILKGVVIGEKSIVGAGSVVTQNIPDGEIWAGNPAKFIRKM